MFITPVNREHARQWVCGYTDTRPFRDDSSDCFFVQDIDRRKQLFELFDEAINNKSQLKIAILETKCFGLIGLIAKFSGVIGSSATDENGNLFHRFMLDADAISRLLNYYLNKIKPKIKTT